MDNASLAPINARNVQLKENAIFARMALLKLKMESAYSAVQAVKNAMKMILQFVWEIVRMAFSFTLKK